MPKKIKCSECKNIERIKKNDERLSSISMIDRKFQQITTNLYQCNAKVTDVFTEEDIKQPRECYYYRSRTETAWQEIRSDILSEMKDFIFNLLKKS